MKATQVLVDHIKEAEGLRLEAYKDTKGKLTIGYGHTSGVKEGDKIGEFVAEEYLANDIELVEGQIERLGLPEMSLRRWDALVDFTFNCGINNFKSSILLRKIRENINDKTIPDEFRRWIYVTKTRKNKATGKMEKVKIKLQGLVDRRDWEAKRWG